MWAAMEPGELIQWMRNYNATSCAQCKDRIPAFSDVSIWRVSERMFELLCTRCSILAEKASQISIDSAGGDQPAAGLESADGVVAVPVEDVPGRQAENIT